jgi:hypothetical protein
MTFGWLCVLCPLRRWMAEGGYLVTALNCHPTSHSVLPGDLLPPYQPQRTAPPGDLGLGFSTKNAATDIFAPGATLFAL